MIDHLGHQLGNYTLVRFLGRGGQAEVYLGEHRYLKSFAALKVLHASLDEQHTEQFLAEAQTLARLVHPSIVRVLDFTVEQGMAVLIMDYSPTGTMRQRYPAGTCLPLATVVSAVSQVASALHYAHSKHVIHRDVKPENLLLGPRDEVLLSDFGLSVFAPSPELHGRLSNPILRWYLYRAGSLPWHYHHFLDYAAEHILLRKVGQNYIFIHRLLLEYFASLDATSDAENAPKHKRHKDHR